MSRIDGENVNFGESFVVEIDSNAHSRHGKLQKALEENKLQAITVLEKAKAEAQKIIEDAKNEAINEALAAADKVREQARLDGHQEGFEAGFQEGLNAMQSEFSQKIALFNSFVQSAFEVKKRILKSSQLEIVELVRAICDKICNKSLDIDHEILYNVTSAAVDMLKEKEVVTIIINPLMREQIFPIIETLKENNALVSEIKIIEDSSVSPDGTIVEGISGRYDARVSSQLDELINKLFSAVHTTAEEEIIALSEAVLLPSGDVSGGTIQEEFSEKKIDNSDVEVEQNSLNENVLPICDSQVDEVTDSQDASI